MLIVLQGTEIMRYQDQCSQQTLREGLEEYSCPCPGLDRFDPCDVRIIAQAFQAHDVIHVLTGIDVLVVGKNRDRLTGGSGAEIERSYVSGA